MKKGPAGAYGAMVVGRGSRVCETAPQLVADGDSQLIYYFLLPADFRGGGAALPGLMQPLVCLPVHAIQYLQLQSPQYFLHGAYLPF